MQLGHTVTGSECDPPPLREFQLYPNDGAVLDISGDSLAS